MASSLLPTPKPPSKHVKVYIRTRPTSNFAHDLIRFDADQKSVHIHSPRNTGDGYINNQQEDWNFAFDQILHNASQEHVYEECAAPIVRSLVEGYNGTILAYGQTGAGKTFTMYVGREDVSSTGATDNFKHRGLIPQTISHVFREIAEKPQFSFIVRVSYLEVYNEQMIDLLSPEEDGSGSAFAIFGEEGLAMPGMLTVVEDKNGSTRVKGLNVKLATSEEQALSHLFEGETNRSIAEHQLNRNSSRSHCIFTIHLEARSKVESTEKIIHSKLNLVDLAGSERVSKTETSGQSLREAMYINKSLTYLEQVVLALADKKREHIPFRQSKMTHVLKDALGGNNNTLLIANVWGEKQHIEETISTLRFAMRMRCVSTAPVINVQYDTVALIKKYEREIKDLKLELSMHDTLSNRSYIQYEPYTENQKAELEKTIKAYLDAESDEFEILSLRHVKEIMVFFKRHVKAIQSIAQAEAAQALKIKESLVSLANKEAALAEHAAKVAEKEEERGGELESAGFAVGVAPPGSKPPPKEKEGRGREAKEKPGKLKKDPTKTNVSAQAAATSAATPVSLQIPAGGKQHGDGDSGEAPLTANSATGGMGGMEDHPSEMHLAESPASPAHSSGGAQPGPKAAHTGPPPSRAEEFERFKRDRGLDLNKALGERKLTLQERKRAARDLAERMNLRRTEIEGIKAQLEQKARYHQPPAGGSGLGGSEDVIIDEEEYNLLDALKQARLDYKEALGRLNSTRVEIEQATRLVDQARQKLMAEFESFYELTYSTPKHDGDPFPGQVEDKMDVAEKFDKMQMERMALEDPDAIPYYNARKNTSRKLQGALGKKVAPGGPFPGPAKQSALAAVPFVKA